MRECAWDISGRSASSGNEKCSEITQNSCYFIILSTRYRNLRAVPDHIFFRLQTLDQMTTNLKINYPVICCKGPFYLDLVSVILQIFYRCWSFNKSIEHSITLSSFPTPFSPQKYCESKTNSLLPLLFNPQFVLKDPCFFFVHNFHN